MMQKRRYLLFFVLVVFSLASLTVAADTQVANSRLSAAQIVEKNVAARGGRQAWRAVQTMSWTGKMEVGGGDSVARGRRIEGGGASTRRMGLVGRTDPSIKEDAFEQVQLPFVFEMKRPRQSRVEIEFAGNTAVQVYDGKNGWKLRPYLGRNDVEPFTPSEAESEAAKSDFDGPLVDYAAKGTKVELAGVEPVEGRDAYKLKLTLKSGVVQHVWIDKETFLDTKLEGTPRRMDGRMRNVIVYQRDFKSLEGLMIPFVFETVVDGYRDTHKMFIDKVVVNPKLEDSRFAKPQ